MPIVPAPTGKMIVDAPSPRRHTGFPAIVFPWSVTPVVSPEGKTTAAGPAVPDAHTGTPPLTVSTWFEAPMPSRAAAPVMPLAKIRSPFEVIGLANPAAELAHAGSPPETVSTWVSVPTPSRVVVGTAFLKIRSPAVVVGSANPAALFAHPGVVPFEVST